MVWSILAGREGCGLVYIGRGEGRSLTESVWCTVLCSNPNHPYLKQWAKECSHHTKDSIMAYLVNQLLPVAYQPVSDSAPQGGGESPPKDSMQSASDGGSQAGEENSHENEETAMERQDESSEGSPVVELMDDIGASRIRVEGKEKIQTEIKTEDDSAAEIGTRIGSETVAAVGTGTGGKTVAEIGARSTENEPVVAVAESPAAPPKRTLRSSTMQRSPCYFSPKRTKKPKPPLDTGPSPGQVATPSPSLPPPSDRGGEEREGHPRHPSLPPGSAPPPANSTPDHATSPAAIPLSVITHHHTPQTHPPVVVSHATPRGVETSATAHPEMMELVTLNDDEFGVSEVPVFALEAGGGRAEIGDPPPRVPLKITDIVKNKQLCGKPSAIGLSKYVRINNLSPLLFPGIIRLQYFLNYLIFS